MLSWERSRHVGLVTLLAILGLCAALLFVIPMTVAGAQEMAIDEINDDLGVGINFGNALEGPREGDWGVTLQESYFETIAEAGFGHVRVPIRFSAYASETAPYEIPDGVDPTVRNADNLWDRIDWVIENAERNDLYVIVDLHHYDELFADVAGERVRFLAIWEQIAIRYANASSRVLFEVLNEPHGQFNDDASLLSTLLADVIAVVRDTNPTRPILVAPNFWNSIGSLDALELPSDPNLIVSVHFYDPFPFTHQGAAWLDIVPPAPAAFDPDLVDFGAGWGNWSWDTSVVPSPTSLQVTYERQWAGLAFGRPGLVAPADLELTVSGTSELAVRCSLGDDDFVVVGRIATTETPTTFNIDMSSCPDTTRSIDFLVASLEFGPLNFSEIELCNTDGHCRRLIETGEQAIESAFAEAAAWGLANDRPIHVGEYGSHGAEGVADLADRAVWTAVVARAARSHGFSTAYWEFGAGFGAYDLATQTWVEPLLNAIFAEPVQDPAWLLGDVDCDSSVDIGDALAIAQLTVGIRTGVDGCSLTDPGTRLNQLAADVDGDGVIDIGDALLIAQCTVGVGPPALCRN